MSRSDPYKKKRRSARTTLLIYGEGQSDEIFLKHLRALYSYNTQVHVTIRKGKGGTADGLVIDASNILGGFDRRVVVLDCDKSNDEMVRARAEAKKRGIELFENDPCLEALLLSILYDGKTFAGNTSSWCKKEFELKFITKSKRGELHSYEIFPKVLLDRQRNKISSLSRLIFLLEGGY